MFPGRGSKVPAFNPWKRDPKEPPYTLDDISNLKKGPPKRQRFYLYDDNIHLDFPTKLAALKVSQSVVSLVSYSGEEEIFQSSGIIIESDGVFSIVLTSADLLRCRLGGNSITNNIKVIVHLPDGESFDGLIMECDFHYNLAAIKIQPNTQLTIASLTYLNDSVAVDPSQIHTFGHQSFGLRPHSDLYDLLPGDLSIAVGRYFTKPYEVMAAPGVFSLDRCDLDCRELFAATCKITRCGVGGPLINRYGNVIGICFYDVTGTPFLPINVAMTWWEHYKKHGELRRPWLGMELTNLYSANLEFLERIMQKFHNILEGVFVEEVTPGSSADSAGIEYGDVIIQFGGKNIRSFLELFKESYAKIGKVVEVLVIRKSNDVPVHLSMVVDELTPDKIYSWPLWENVK